VAAKRFALCPRLLASAPLRPGIHCSTPAAATACAVGARLGRFGSTVFGVTHKSRPLFAFAGIWERWSGWGENERDVSTCAIITCEAEGGDRSIHPRMPVILPQKAYSTWLDPRFGLDTLLSLLRPYRGLRHMAVSTLVNDPKNDGLECLREGRVR
jgi:putative SOS response-associated peptidase YedK